MGWVCASHAQSIRFRRITDASRTMQAVEHDEEEERVRARTLLAEVTKAVRERKGTCLPEGLYNEFYYRSITGL